MHGVLTNHGVDDEQDFIRIYGIADIARLCHQGFIDAQAAGGIDDDHIVLLLFCFSNTALGDVHRVPVRGTHLVVIGIQGGTWVWSEGRDFRALADDLQLLHGSWALQVTGHEHRGVPLLREVLGQFTGQGGFTSTLQTGQHDDGRWILGQVQPAGFSA